MSWEGGLNRYTIRIEKDSLKNIKKITSESLNLVVFSSPVDTGAFRGGWNVSLGMKNLSFDSEALQSDAQVMSRNLSEIDKITLKTRTINVSNGAPYGSKLEYLGWSDQAPGGMVRISAGKIAAKYGIRRFGG